MAANINRPVRILLANTSNAVEVSTPPDDAIPARSTCDNHPERVKSQHLSDANMQPVRESRDSENTVNLPSGAGQFCTLSGKNDVLLLRYGTDIAEPRESQRTGRALMRALRDNPETPDAATPAQAWALAVMVGVISLAFLLCWALFGLSAPMLKS